MFPLSVETYMYIRHNISVLILEPTDCRDCEEPTDSMEGSNSSKSECMHFCVKSSAMHMCVV